MINELIFFIQIIILSIFIFNLSSNEKKIHLYQIFSVILVIMNLLVNQEIKLFGLHACAIEPYSVGLFWLGIIIYSIDGEIGAKNLLRSTIIINLFTIIMFTSMFISTPTSGNWWTFIYDTILTKGIISLTISTITFYFSYFIERKIYLKLIKKNINCILSQSISVSIGQLIDTILFSFLYFDKSFNTIIEIILFSMIIKFLCIWSYSLLFYLKDKKIF